MPWLSGQVSDKAKHSIGEFCVCDPIWKFCSCCLTCDAIEASFYSSCNIQWAEASDKDVSCSILLLSRQHLCRVTWPAFKVPITFPRIKACSSHSLGKLYKRTEMALNSESPPTLLKTFNTFNSISTEFLQIC